MTKVTVSCQIDPNLLQRLDRVVRYNNQATSNKTWNRNRFLMEVIQDYVTAFEKDIPAEFELAPLKTI